MTTTEGLPDGAADPAAAPSGMPALRTLTRAPEQVPAPERPASLRRILAQLVLIALLVMIGVIVGAGIAASRLAAREAVTSTTNTANLMALAVVQPVVTDALYRGEPAAVAAVDAVVRRSVLPSGVVRVKIWRPDGTVLYSDDPDLVGVRFELDANQRAALAEPQTRAEVTDLDEPENALDRGAGKLIEVYRPVWTPSGRQLLFEIYTDYGPVSDRAADLRRALLGLLISTVALLAVLLTPVVARLVRQLRTAARHREELMQKAIDASEEERRRIAVGLHDGPVQNLVAGAYATAAAAARAEADGRPRDAEVINAAGAGIRDAVGSLRSVLVDLYPPTLAGSGLETALRDLAPGLRARGLVVDLDVDGRADGDTGSDDAKDEPALTEAQERLVYRTARECVRNIAAHAEASHVTLRLHRTDRGVELWVQDDGRGFEVDDVVAAARAGHLGLPSMIEQAEQAGAELQVASEPGAGTRWHLVVPLRADVGAGAAG